MRVFALLLALSLAAAPALAQAPGPAARDDGTTAVHLSEHAERLLRQDRLTVSLRADVTGPDAARVQAEINRRMAAALDKARVVPGVRAETRGYWVSQERPDKAPVRWHGQQMLLLRSADSAAALALAGELQQTGLVMSGMQFELSPGAARAAQDELTAEALGRLRERAAKVAEALGLTLRHIREIRIGEVGGPVPPRPMMMRAEAAGASQAPVAEPGETTVRVSVEAEVILGSRETP